MRRLGRAGHSLFGILAGLAAATGIGLTAAERMTHPTLPSSYHLDAGVTGPGFIAVTRLPGDTLAYGLTWGAAARADGYSVSVTAAPATGWTGLPVAVIVPGTALTFKAINTGQPDVVFTAVVCSRKSGTTYTNKCSSTSWTVSRQPGPPGPPVVDSSATVVGVIDGVDLLPDNIAVATGGTQQLCAIVAFTDGSQYPAGDLTQQENAFCVLAMMTKYPTAQASQAAKLKASQLCVLLDATGGTVTQMGCVPQGMRRAPSTVRG